MNPGKRFLTTYLTITGFGAGGNSGVKSFKENLNRSKAVQTDSKGLEEASSSPLGPGCREFESRHSDQKSRIRFCGVCTFLFVWNETRKIKCDCPVDSRLPTARRRQHLYFLPSGKKMQTSLATQSNKWHPQVKNRSMLHLVAFL